MDHIHLSSESKRSSPWLWSLENSFKKVISKRRRRSNFKLTHYPKYHFQVMNYVKLKCSSGKVHKTKSFLISLLTILILNKPSGQHIRHSYVGIPLDSGLNLVVKFIDGFKGEFTSLPRHMSKSLHIAFHFKATGSTIVIQPNNLFLDSSLALNNFGVKSFIKGEIIFSREGKMLVDYNNKIIFVKQKKFERKNNFAFIIDGRKYLQGLGMTNGYGIMRKRPKQNKNLQKQLALIGPFLDQYHVECFSGLKAYQKFGRKYIFGVIVIKRKKEI